MITIKLKKNVLQDSKYVKGQNVLQRFGFQSFLRFHKSKRLKCITQISIKLEVNEMTFQNVCL